MWFDTIFSFPSFWTLVALILAAWAFRRAGSARKELAVLRAELKAFGAVPAPVAAPVEPQAAAAGTPGLVWSGRVPDEAPPPADAPPADDAGPPPLPPESVAQPSPARDIEQRLASRWLVWLGGLAIAIGGVLFVKYAVDNQLLPPALRCLIGLAAGLVLIGAGEWLRRRSAPSALSAPEPDYVPSALTAAGLLIAFASIYAAHAWYGLIGPTTAFAGAALVAFAGFALSLTQGPLIAALGLLGAYGTPLIIPSAEPSAWTFFPYLLIIIAASFALLRHRHWPWLGYAALAGSLAWTLLWLNGGVFEPRDQLPIGLFLLAMAAIALFGTAGRAILAEDAGTLANLRISKPFFRMATAGLGATGLGLAALAHASHHSNLSLALLLAGLAGALALAWSSAAFARLARVAGLIVLITLMVWRDAGFIAMAMDEHGLWSNVLGADAARFLAWMLGFGALLTHAGLAGLWRRPEPVAWASVAAAAPVLFLLGAWARVDAVLAEAQWALLAGIVSTILAASVWGLRGRLEQQGINLALGLVTIAVAILAVFGLDRLLDGVWTTLAVAALVPLAAVAGRALPISLLGPVAAVLASLVALHLFFSPDLIEDRRDLPLGAHWMLYGLGLPALMFWQSSRWMRDTYPRSAMAVEGSALTLAIALISLELRVLIAGGVAVGEASLLEAAAHIMAWLGAAYGLMHGLGETRSPVRLWAARLLLAASCAALVLLNLGSLNPVVTEEPLRGNVLFNDLVLAYLAPAILLGLIASRLDSIGWRKALAPLGSLALLLVLAYVTLQTKRVFQGRILVAEWLSQAESYAYSAVWLATALVLLLAGIRFASQPVRYGGLAIIILTVIKVFLIDMSDLGGLYRIASFAGLGLCLVGIGYLYTRFLHQPGAPAAAPV